MLSRAESVLTSYIASQSGGTPRLPTTAVLLLALLLVAGCDKEKPNPVSGTVTFQGTPVAAGMIRFSNPTAAVDIMASLKLDGAYEVVMAKGKGLPEGTYQVAIMPPRAELPLGPMRPMPKPRSYPNIPEKYRDPSTSGLTFAVKAGNNRCDVAMKP